MRSKSLCARKLGNVVVFVHGSRAPTDSEWESVLDYYRQAPDASRLRALVYTEGGAPDAKQRARLVELGHAQARIAVLTTSALARAAGIAVSWFIPHLRLFKPSEVERALDHLETTTTERVELRQTLAELRREIAQSTEQPRT
ncbi:MAG: hypothetical protein ABI895_36945 [Deltaproteobacteria bacterium]